MKLSPNVTSIEDMARAAEAGGADGISLINTITGMKIDDVIERLKGIDCGGKGTSCPDQLATCLAEYKARNG